MKRTILITIFVVCFSIIAKSQEEVDWKIVENATNGYLAKYAPVPAKIESSNLKGVFWFCERNESFADYYSYDFKKGRRSHLFSTADIARQYNLIVSGAGNDSSSKAANIATSADTAIPDTISGKDIYINEIIFDNTPDIILNFKGKYWNYNLNSSQLTGSDYRPAVFEKERNNDTIKYSYDSLYLITGFDNNVYVKHRDDKFFYQATIDGSKVSSYNAPNRRETYLPVPTNADWLTNTHTFYYLKIDKSRIKETPLVNYLNKDRPVIEKIKMPMPGDTSLIDYSLIIYNADLKRSVSVFLNKYPNQKIEFKRGYKGNSLGKDIFLTRIDRGYQNVDLCKVSSVTGELTEIITEKTVPHFNVQLFNSIVFKSGNRVLWWSERGGYGQYFLYDGSGRLLNAVTPKDIVAGRVVMLDTLNNQMIFEGYNLKNSSNPSYRYYYRVRLDGRHCSLLTPQDAMHDAELSKDGSYLIDTYSTMTKAPVVQIIDIKSGRTSEVCRTDLSKLVQQGWKPPVLVKLKAADDSTDLYGVVYFPFNLDTTKRYPIISNVYPGPQSDQIPLSFTIDDNYNQSLAQLGFVVVTIAPRGSSIYRGKDFHCFGYGNLRDYPLSDDKYCIEQLANMYSFIDLGRVGIYGHSGGGFMAAAAMFTYPDFYKVGIAASGNHDNNIYINWWADVYNGLNRRIPTNIEIAHNLRGKLLLVTGDMDRNVPPFSTFKLADALIKSKKNFDMLVIPGADHYLDSDYYFNKIRYYFKDNLLVYRADDIDIVSHK